MDFEVLRDRFRKKVIETRDHDFEDLALEIFKFQARHSLIYRKFLELLGLNPQSIKNVEEIPFLPISTFRNHIVRTGTWDPQIIFESSGTTGSLTRSRHHVRDINWYYRITEKAFSLFYGPVGEYCFLGLLPSYIGRENSSLICMFRHFIDTSSYSESDFYLHNIDDLLRVIEQLEYRSAPTILLGVGFALFDLPNDDDLKLRSTTLMDTGGMKGRREELTRQELHQIVCQRFDVKYMDSEYGMTELMSQSYSRKDGHFRSPPWMRVSCREINDPFQRVPFGKSGLLNIIDLANIDTCCFIATDDLGTVYPDFSFDVQGRADGSELRGCSLLYESSQLAL